MRLRKASSRSARPVGSTIVIVLGLAAAFAPRPATAQQSAFVLHMLSGDSAVNEAGRTALDNEFTTDQLRYQRVLQARIDTRFGIKRLYRERGIRYPAAEIFLRIFKRERVLELWVRPEQSETFSLLKEYRICALAGEIGPKRSQGDGQTPEGYYEIDNFNPNSEYLLSLHINYPNRSDRILGSRNGLGGDIYIHGGCKTEGCLAVTDEHIKELYWIGVEARAAGQERIPVHIFPARLDQEEMTRLAGAFPDRADLRSFWTSLKPGYDYFERMHQLPAITVNERGEYLLRAPGKAAEEAQLASPTRTGSR
jgi:murein L,D-transpeptidase YafK